MAAKIPMCKSCGGSGHYKINCLMTARTVPKAKKRYIKPESDKAKERRLKVREEWFELNPPDAPDGRWYCYLDGLSEYGCWSVLSREQIEEHGLEHVISKARSRAKKFDVANLRAACPACNQVKRSWSVEELLGMYEHWGGPRS